MPYMGAISNLMLVITHSLEEWNEKISKFSAFIAKELFAIDKIKHSNLLLQIFGGWKHPKIIVQWIVDCIAILTLP